MIIPEDLKNQIDHGDHQLIAEMYNERHSMGENPDYRTVTSKYVGLVLNGHREANPETAAEEIVLIAMKYLQFKKNFRDQLLTV